MNPFDKLVRMIEQRLERQRDAIRDTEIQLDTARKSRDDFQKDLDKVAKEKKS